MLEQTVRLVTSSNTAKGTILRFAPLGNRSHQKFLHTAIENLKNGESKLAAFEDTFATLQTMNSDGWKLESFASILDDNELRMQVAIFSREV